MIKLSVVTPTYNRKDSLRLTLDGLSRQEYPFDKFEVIAVSDGSTDGTDEMLEDYKRSSPYRLRVISQSNGGPSRARNRGVQEANFEVVVFLDDDVEPAPEFLSRHASHHLEDDRIAVLGPMSPDPARSPDEPAWIAWEHAMLQKIYDMFRPGGEYNGRPAGPHHFYSGNASVRREWLIKVGGFDERYTRQEDVELAVRLQRDCGVHFEFDFMAEGLHRPQRTLDSWLRIPNAYGAFDAQRIQAGLLNWSDVEANIRKRNTATRFLTRMIVACPLILPGIVAIITRCVTPLYRAGSRSSALAALSAVYNVSYVHAVLQTPAIHGGKE